MCKRYMVKNLLKKCKNFLKITTKQDNHAKKAKIVTHLSDNQLVIIIDNLPQIVCRVILITNISNSEINVV